MSSCPICAQIFSSTNYRPLIVGKCGHTMCRSCVEQLFLIRKKLICPMDNQPLDHPASSFDDFPTNFALLNIENNQEEDLAINAKKDLEASHEAPKLDVLVNNKLSFYFDVKVFEEGFEIKTKEYVANFQSVAESALEEIENLSREGISSSILGFSCKIITFPEIFLKMIVSLKSLHKLEVELSTQLKGANDLFEVVAELKTLTDLKLSCGLNEIPASFEDLKSLVHLQALNLDFSRNKLKDIKPLTNTLGNFSWIKNLEIDLSENTDLQKTSLIDLLLVLSKFSMLERLNLSFGNLKCVDKQILEIFINLLKKAFSLKDFTIDLTENPSLDCDDILLFIEQFSAVSVKSFSLTLKKCKKLDGAKLTQIAEKIQGLKPQIDANLKADINPESAVSWLMQSELLKSNGCRGEALEALNSALKMNSDFVEALNARASILTDMGNYKDALHDLDHSISIKRNADAYYIKARIFRYLKKEEDAENCYKLANWLAKDEDFTAPWLRQSKSFYSVGLNKKALEALNSALKINSDSIEALNDKANIFADMGNFKDALRDLDHSISIKRNANAYYIKARILSALGEEGDAQNSFNLAESLAKDEDFRNYYKANALHGLGLSDQGNIEDKNAFSKDKLELKSLLRLAKLSSDKKYCLNLLETVLLDLKLKSYPIYSDAYIQKGWILTDIGEKGAGLVCFDKAIELSPKNPIAYIAKGDHLSNSENYQEAITCYNQAINLGHKKAYINKGESLLKLGQKKAASNCFESAVKLDPKDVSTYVEIGECLSRLNKEKEAMIWCDRALKIEPKSKIANYLKIDLLISTGQIKASLNCLNQLIKFAPTSISYAKLTRALIADNRIFEACDILEESITPSIKELLTTKLKGLTGEEWLLNLKSFLSTATQIKKSPEEKRKTMLLKNKIIQLQLLQLVLFIEGKRGKVEFCSEIDKLSKQFEQAEDQSFRSASLRLNDIILQEKSSRKRISSSGCCNLF